MIGLRGLQVARVGAGTVLASEGLEVVAGGAGATDVVTATLAGGGPGFGVGSAVGVALTPSKCVGP
jgi:hypothetical protein